MIKRCIKIMFILPALCAIFAHAQAAQVLESGAAGETVMVLTRRLCELGYMEKSVDEYDDSVFSAIGDFQTANGLERTGVADIATQQLMNSDNAVTRQEYIFEFVNLHTERMLTTGSSGDDVSRMQAELNRLGYYAYKPDGKFGEATRRAVVYYQRANGLEPTGTADGPMFRRLYDGESISYEEYIQKHCAVKGDSGTNVRAIQRRLIELGYYSGESTGTYGDNTARAVSRFQYDNGISQSGNVDAQTCEMLFSLTAAYAEDDGSLYPGDTGDDVYAMQQQLAKLGFYEGEPDGSYDRNTETAVLLFRLANGFDVTANASLEVLNAMYAAEVKDASQLSIGIEGEDADVRQQVCDRALSMEGERFAEDSGLFPGFGFVRYVYAGCGVAIGDPSYAIERMGNVSDTVTDMAPGNIVVLGSHAGDDSLVLRFAVCVGGGSIAYVDEMSGYVQIVQMDSMDYTSAYVWKLGN